MLKVTVITVCYNEKNRLRKTIESVCNQTYSGIEYLIIDGASTDGTQDMLKEYLAGADKNILFYSEIDYGIYNAMNRGIARAGGDYIYFLNAGDCFYNETVVEDVVSHIKDMDTIYYGKVCMVYTDGLKQIRDFAGMEGRIEQELHGGGMPCHQAVFAPRDALADHYFREKYRIRADFEWLLYSIGKEYVCKSVPVTISYYDASGTSGRLKNDQLFRQEEQGILREYQVNRAADNTMEFCKTEMTLRKMSRKYESLFCLMSSWLALGQQSISVAEYFAAKNYKHVAIYGMSHMGLRLWYELESRGIKVDYGIDQDKDHLCLEMKIVSPEEKLDETDAVVVTAVSSFYEIVEMLGRKITCPVISLEDIIYDMCGGLE